MFYRKKAAAAAAAAAAASSEKTAVRYTGWQTIGGLTYYYDKDGNKVTGDQVIGGTSYHFSSDGVLDASNTNLCIDVSTWNGTINWSQAKSSGVSYAIIRCGYRGSSKGALVEDPSFRTNMAGAQAAGIRTGVYFFSQATTEAEAVEEASMVLDLVSGYSLSLPIFLDVETSGGRGDAISVGMRTKCIQAFCRTITNAGYSAGVYANTNWLTEKINTSQLTSYHIWMAQYAASPTYQSTRYDIWQYTKTGRVYGDLMSLLTTMKGLPLAYNKDMQEDKEPAFDAIDTAQACISLFSGMLATITFRKEIMRLSAVRGFTNATDAADYLVVKGVPFRDAHGIIGRLVLHCIDSGKSIEDLSVSELKQFSPAFDEDIYDAVSLRTCVEKRLTLGAPGSDMMKKVIKQEKEWLGEWHSRITED